MKESTRKIVNIFYEEKYEKLSYLLDELSNSELLTLYSEVLEYYGDSTAIEFIIKTHCYFLLFGKEEIKQLLSIMHHNPLLGRDTLITFYAIYTETNKSSIDFMGDINDLHLLNLFDIDKDQKSIKYKNYIINRNILSQNESIYNKLGLSHKEIDSITSFKL